MSKNDVDIWRTKNVDKSRLADYHKNKGGTKIIKTKENTVQSIIPFEEIKENGIIKLKNEKYIKIIKIRIGKRINFKFIQNIFKNM